MCLILSFVVAVLFVFGYDREDERQWEGEEEEEDRGNGRHCEKRQEAIPCHQVSEENNGSFVSEYFCLSISGQILQEF